MRHTKNETVTQTLTRLIRALDKKQPVSLTYVKSDGTTTIRTIETYDIVISNAGDILIKAMDRETGEARSFRLDRIVSYSTHRAAYLVPRPVVDEPKQRTTTGLTTVTVLYPVDCPIAARIDLLASALAA